MTGLWTRVEFWISMAFVVAVKLRHSPTLTFRQVLAVVAVSVSGALIFTDPMVAWFGFESDQMKYGVAALVGLTCEQFARSLLTMTLKDFIDLWRPKS